MDMILVTWYTCDIYGDGTVPPESEQVVRQLCGMLAQEKIFVVHSCLLLQNTCDHDIRYLDIFVYITVLH